MPLALRRGVGVRAGVRVPRGQIFSGDHERGAATSADRSALSPRDTFSAGTARAADMTSCPSSSASAMDSSATALRLSAALSAGPSAPRGQPSGAGGTRVGRATGAALQHRVQPLKPRGLKRRHGILCVPRPRVQHGESPAGVRQCVAFQRLSAQRVRLQFCNLLSDGLAVLRGVLRGGHSGVLAGGAGHPAPPLSRLLHIRSDGTISSLYRHPPIRLEHRVRVSPLRPLCRLLQSPATFRQILRARARGLSNLPVHALCICKNLPVFPVLGNLLGKSSRGQKNSCNSWEKKQ